MSRKKVSFTPLVKKFIIDKMCEGYDVAQIATNWPDKVPNAGSIYRKSADDPEFAEAMDRAYSTLLMLRMDELHRVASMTPDEAYPNMDWRQAEAILKRRMDEAKFVLSKMADKLSKRFTNRQEINHIGATTPQIMIVNYSQPDNITHTISHDSTLLDVNKD